MLTIQCLERMILCAGISLRCFYVMEVTIVIYLQRENLHGQLIHSPQHEKFILLKPRIIRITDLIHYTFIESLIFHATLNR